MTKRFRVSGLVLVVVLALTSVAAAQRTAMPSLEGTWIVDAAETDGGTPGFQALLSFHEGGTLTETNSDAGSGAQSTSRGVWEQVKRDGHRTHYNATFQLFVFEDGEAVGRIQVRAAVHLDRNDHLTADTVIDFIAPDGTIARGIDSGPFEGTRMAVEGP